jgi:hypothetical protein
VFPWFLTIDALQVHQWYANFSASLWQNTTSKVEIVMPLQKICHVIRWQWNEKTLVM